MASPDDHASAAAVATEIMEHLRRNPAAGDTARGVWRWWLTASRAFADVATVETVLNALAERGEVGMRVLASGERFYFGRPAGSERGRR